MSRLVFVGACMWGRLWHGVGQGRTRGTTGCQVVRKCAPGMCPEALRAVPTAVPGCTCCYCGNLLPKHVFVALHALARACSVACVEGVSSNRWHLARFRHCVFCRQPAPGCLTNQYLTVLPDAERCHALSRTPQAHIAMATATLHRQQR
jgi:hypothetical protein